jgi:hypothetical protein
VIASSEAFRATAKKALKVRTEGGYPVAGACNVYELIIRQQLDLQFFAVPTLEGMYLEDGRTKRICVSAFRPPGRQRFTAAHELAHSFLGHGTKVDTIEELRDSRSTARELEEQLADTFATFLMMPSSAVHFGFGFRSIKINKAKPAQVYAMATWLGVGYSTLSTYLCYTVGAISKDHLSQLLRHEPKGIKSQLVGQQTTKEVFQLDDLWNEGCAQGQVGDFFLGIAGCSGDVLTRINDGLFVAERPGQTTGTLDSGARVEINIARENYVGFYEYRYMREEN